MEGGLLHQNGGEGDKAYRAYFCRSSCAMMDRQKTTSIPAVCSGPLWGPYEHFPHKGPCRNFGDLHEVLHDMIHIVPCAPPAAGPTQAPSEDS